MIDIAAGLLALAILLHRSRSLPSLRPAAVAVAAFACLDAGRLAWSPWVAAGAWPWSWIDVAVVVGMPGLWMGLLAPRDPAPKVAVEQVRGPHEVPVGTRRPWRLGRSETEHESGERRHPPILPRLAPLVLCLLYAGLLLALRHWTPVREHWAAWLQAPRLAGLAMALWVVLRKDEGPGAVVAPDPLRGVGGPRAPSSWGPCDLGGRPNPGAWAGNAGTVSSAEHAAAKGEAQGRSPSVTIGLILAGSAGVLVVVGAWGDWPGVVRPGAALSWLAVCVVAVRARE